MSYEELFEVFLPAEGRLKGASQEFLKGLPFHEVTEHNKMDISGDSICCTVCLQVNYSKLKQSLTFAIPFVGIIKPVLHGF